MLQAQPSEERNGEALLGYSGQTALRREQCNVDDKALLGNDPVKQHGIIATVAMQWLSTHLSTM
jgi:hypothetical protein